MISATKIRLSNAHCSLKLLKLDMFFVAPFITKYFELMKKRNSLLRTSFFNKNRKFLVINIMLVGCKFHQYFLTEKQSEILRTITIPNFHIICSLVKTMKVWK